MMVPTLPDEGRFISKLIFGLKRRRGETMSAWLVRHDDALDDVRRIRGHQGVRPSSYPIKDFAEIEYQLHEDP